MEDLVFSKDKMMERLEREGKLELVDDKSRELMDLIDGLPAEKNRFKALVYDEIEYMVKHPKSNKWVPVNYNDCIEKSLYDKGDGGNK